MKIKRKSVVTGIERTMDIPANPEDFMLWSEGFVAIDEAMPYLNIADREFILSGMTPNEWEELFQAQEKGVLC